MRVDLNQLRVSLQAHPSMLNVSPRHTLWIATAVVLFVVVARLDWWPVWYLVTFGIVWITARYLLMLVRGVRRGWKGDDRAE